MKVRLDVFRFVAFVPVVSIVVQKAATPMLRLTDRPSVKRRCTSLPWVKVYSSSPRFSALTRTRSPRHRLDTARSKSG